MTAETTTEAASAEALLQAAEQALAAAGVDEARLKAEWLLSSVLGCRRLEIVLHRKRVPAGEQVGQFREMVARVSAGEPVQYVVGETDFLGRPFHVDRRALIPRPETELLVEQVLAAKNVWKAEAPAVADVGTGSGCIAVSLALARPAARLIAVDRSPEALELAVQNARALGVDGRIAFRHGDLLEGLRARSLNAVVSNPPYIAADALPGLPREIREHEPRLALDGGPQGLDVITRLVPQAHRALRVGGGLFLEIGETQGAAVAALLEQAGFQQVEIRRDLAGRDRIAVGNKR